MIISLILCRESVKADSPRVAGGICKRRCEPPDSNNQSQKGLYMTDLIPIFQNNFAGETVNTVNARELHIFLDVKQEFSKWIKKRIQQYQFEENKDYVRIAEKCEANNATLHEYYFSLDMGKHLSMVEKGTKGKQARDYFIACEKKAFEKIEPLDEISVAKRYLLALEEKQKLQKDLQKQKAINDTFIATAENVTLRNAGKLLNKQPQKFIDSLKGIYLFYEGSALVPYIRFIQQGIFTVKETIIEIHGESKTRLQTLITPKGIDYFSKKGKMV